MMKINLPDSLINKLTKLIVTNPYNQVDLIISKVAKELENNKSIYEMFSSRDAYIGNYYTIPSFSREYQGAFVEQGSRLFQQGTNQIAINIQNELTVSNIDINNRTITVSNNTLYQPPVVLGSQHGFTYEE